MMRRQFVWVSSEFYHQVNTVNDMSSWSSNLHFSSAGLVLLAINPSILLHIYISQELTNAHLNLWKGDNDHGNDSIIISTKLCGWAGILNWDQWICSQMPYGLRYTAICFHTDIRKMLCGYHGTNPCPAEPGYTLSLQTV